MTVKVSKVPTAWFMRLAALPKRREFWLLLGGGALLTLLLWWLIEPFGAMMAQIGDLREWILTFGAMAPLVYIGIFSLQILFAPIPGQFLGVMGGYLFGVFFGSLYSITGMALGAGLAIWLGRRFGRPLLERFFDPTQLALWEKKMRMRSAFTWWLLFLFPVPDLIFYAAGLSSTSLRTLLIALIAGRGLGLLLANIDGALDGKLCAGMDSGAVGRCGCGSPCHLPLSTACAFAGIACRSPCAPVVTPSLLFYARLILFARPFCPKISQVKLLDRAH